MDRQALQILDFVPSGCCIVAENGEILFWNKVLETWTERTSLETVGCDLFALYPELARPRFRDRIRDVLETGAPTVFSSPLNPQFFPCCRSGGRPRIQQTTVNRLTPGEDGRARVIIAVSDVTDPYERGEKYRQARAQAVEEARIRGESEERLMRVLENMPVMAMAFDRDFRLLFWNQEAARVTGYGADEVLRNQDFSGLFFPDEAYRAWVLEQFLERIGDYRDWELDFACRDGSHRTIALSSIAKRVPIPGWPGDWGIGVDVTDRKRAEKILREAQKRESLGILAGGIAHDFNNLFGSVLGSLELAKKKLAADAPVLGHLRNIENEIARAAELSRKMLDLSGQGRFESRRLDLNRFLEGLKSILSAGESEKPILEFRLQPGLPPLDADESQLEQALVNLVDNAVEALTEQVGHVVISTRLEELDEEAIRHDFPGQPLAPGPYLVLAVVDNGCGIPPENLTRIFDPFFSTKLAGRGLSLPVTLGILRAHRAGIHVISTPGVGSTFELYFPVAAVSPPLESQAPVRDAPLPRIPRVLLVDDEPLLLETTSELLELLGYDVITARNGAEAVASYRERQGEIGLIIMDLTMPEMDGREATLAIKALDPHARILLSSGYSEHDVSASFSTQDLVGFLPKPYRLAQLEAALEKVFGPTSASSGGDGAPPASFGRPASPS